MDEILERKNVNKQTNRFFCSFQLEAEDFCIMPSMNSREAINCYGRFIFIREKDFDCLEAFGY